LAERAGLSERGLSDLERGVRRSARRSTIQLLVEALQLGALERAALVAARRQSSHGAVAQANYSPGPSLPVPLTSFIGREKEAAEIKRLLATTRLLTLTGAGGVGKTRLALAVATVLRDEYVRGIWPVELGALADPALVTRVVASALGVREEKDHSLLATLGDVLGSRRLLLLLDNCEHLVEACAGLVSNLLGHCPELRVLATSRAPLRIGGEVTWRVPSLSLLGSAAPPAAAEDAPASEAVRLFTARAAEALPSFRLTMHNASNVARVCSQLDGIPLAIELAAARVTVLSAEQIAERLDDRLRLLTSANRTAVPRQQTLRNTVDWSYGLLSEPERRVFNRLAVFAGGWTLEAAEAVCAGEGIEPGDVLDLLARLVDQSMVQVEWAEQGPVRYRLLETLRQYASEKLRSAGEESLVRTRHLGWAQVLAEHTVHELWRAEQVAGLRRLEREHDNLRAALAWSEAGADTVEAGLRTAAGLVRFWHVHGHLAEASGWYRRLLAVPSVLGPTLGRAQALTSLGLIEGIRGEMAVCVPVLEESQAMWRELGKPRGLALATFTLGYMLGWSQVDTQRAVALLTESVEVSRDFGLPWVTYLSLGCLGELARIRGEYDAAEALLDESWTLARASGDRWGSALTRFSQGLLALNRGNVELSRQCCQEGLILGKELGDSLG
jgi:predicted ATPase